jgi:hypothetical protein
MRAPKAYDGPITVDAEVVTPELAAEWLTANKRNRNLSRERVEKYQEAIYIISHRKESMKYCTNGEIVYLEKKNGITVRSTTFNNE